MITTQGIADIANFILNHVDHATYDLDGNTHNRDIYSKSVTDNIIIVNLHFEDTVAGNIGNFKLITSEGVEFAVKPELITKPNTKGLLVRFKIAIKEV